MVGTAGSGQLGCFSANQIVLNGAWRRGVFISSYAVPMFFLQVCVFVSLARLLAYLIKPLGQPKIIAEILVRSNPKLIKINC